MKTDIETAETPDQPATRAPARRPVHELVYLGLREMVLFGDLAPGQPVTIQGLSEALGAGMTPVREAIRRLISDGALAFQDNRRVSVPVLTRGDVAQLIFLRKTVETELARRAAQAADEALVEELSAIDAALDRAILDGDVANYLRTNYQFHARLYRAASAPILSELAGRLWLRFGPSLRVVCGRLGTQNLPDWHKELLQSLRTGDAEAAALATMRDMEQGMALVVQALDPTSPGAGSVDSK